MTLPLSHHDPADEEAAALWAARLDGATPSSADLREFASWLDGHPARRALFAEYSEFAADLGQLLPALAASGRIVAPAAHRPRRNRLPAFALGGLAAAAAAVAIFFAVRPAPGIAAPAHYATAAAQRHSLTLADGTHIDLSARTRVTIALGAAERRVQLAAGQAFFEVVKDTGKPFTVETPAGSVLVTGTRFAVRTDPDAGLDVVVAEGRVQVTPAANASPVTLGAGQHLSTAHAQVSVEALSPESLADTLAWREGRIVFNATPVDQALAGFARHHDRPITVSPAAAALRVGGRYNLDDLDGFLDGLEEILPVQITRSPNGPVQVVLRDTR